MLVAVRNDQGDYMCRSGLPAYESAQMLRTLSRLDPVAAGFPAPSTSEPHPTAFLRGPHMRAKLRELGLDTLRARFEEMVAARVAATRAAVQVRSRRMLCWLRGTAHAS